MAAYKKTYKVKTVMIFWTNSKNLALYKSRKISAIKATNKLNKKILPLANNIITGITLNEFKPLKTSTFVSKA